MNTLKFFAMILLAISLITTACMNTDEAKNLDATISITSPTPGQVFEKGDTILIKANIEAPQELHGWQVIIRKAADNSVVYENDRHEHGEALFINEKWINNVTQHADMILEVTAALSHSGDDLKTETVKFHCHPN